ncbi:MAG: antibiotic biosynthesis monooxygenase [Deltaproteobacteria bacterium]|nr:antibiotic biosynthesis monooxygenase [Deltaproteobacteria bacterium]MBW1820014.1 antibiotic biosynthesis monooxygenase [Deltaproteobacteria bacterium]
MPFYQLKITVLEDKDDEFVRNLHSLWFEFLKEDGCRSYEVYRDIEKKNAFSLTGEFDNHAALEKHFRTRNFEILLGAARTLGESVRLIISDILETGGYELAKSKIGR